MGDLTWLKHELKRRGLSGRKLAEKINRSPANTAKIINGQVIATVDFYHDIAKVLDLPLNVVLSKSGIIPPSLPADPQTEEILSILAQLPPEAQREVLEFANFKRQTLKPSK